MFSLFFKQKTSINGWLLMIKNICDENHDQSLVQSKTIEVRLQNHV